MKVLLINVTCGTGSTGVIAVEIATRLESLGHKAYIAYGQGMSTYHKSYKIGGILENKVHAFWHTRVCGREGFGTRRGTKRFIRWIEQLQPDVVQILNLHSNFLHFPMLFTYLKNKKIPVVYALYDCWPFTGKCTHLQSRVAENGKQDVVTVLVFNQDHQHGFLIEPRLFMILKKISLQVCQICKSLFARIGLKVRSKNLFCLNGQFI